MLYVMLQTIVLSLLAGLAGLWIATKFIPGVSFTGDFKNFLIVGVILGIIVAVLRPLLNLLSFLVKIVVLLGVILLVVWALDVFFPELNIPDLMALFWTGLAVSGATLIFSLFGRGKL
jgi:putative membrane protein